MSKRSVQVDRLSESNIASRFTVFTKALAKLSKKTGVVIQSTGGVMHYEPDEIQSVSYYNDYSSGDLSPIVRGK